MKNLEIKEIKQYLKSIVDLESLVYQQEKIVEEAKNSLVKQEVQKISKGLQLKTPIHPYKPQKKTFVLQEPYKPAPFAYNKKLIAILLLVMVISGFLSYLSFNYSDRFRGDTAVIWGYVVAISLVALVFSMMGIIGYLNFAIKNKKKYDERIKRYEKEVKEYEIALNEFLSKKEIYDAEYQKKLDEYNLNVENYKKEYADYQLKLEENKKQNEREYQDALAIADRNYEIATEQYQKLCNTLEKTKSNLESLYNTGIIFPKYRNFVAVCSMYEYFGSGRVDSLEGANGAYNLYESELRQNMIINSLEKISTNLEIIKSNQYILYTELKENNEKINSTIREISNSIKLSLNSIKRIEDMSVSIAENTYINAYCSKINAENTRVMATAALLS